MSSIENTIKQVLRIDYRTHHKPKTDLSPSSFPVCSLVWFTKMWHQRNTGYHENKTGVLLNIFAEAGKGLHKHIQYGLGFSGRQYGHYYCDDYKCEGYVDGSKWRPKPDNKKVHWNTRDNICPHCGKGMQYLEIEIRDGELTMCIDTIMLNDDNRTYSVYDFKSSSIKKADEGKCLNKINMFQIESYVVEVIEHLSFTVSHYGLIYFPRDNPNKYVTFTYEVNDKMLRRSEEFLRGQYRGWTRAKASVEKYNFDKLYEARLCHSESDYYQNYHSYDVCPLLHLCNDKKATSNFLKTFMAYSDQHKDESWFDIIERMTRNKARRTSI